MSIDFVAIDFETANRFRWSPCAIGISIVRNSKVVEQITQLICPPNATDADWFDDFNISIHGITWEMVKDKPKFLDVWNSLIPKIGNLPLVAHNAAFDIGVLRESLDEEGGEWPTLTYTCTLVTSRLILDLPSYSLPFVADALKVELKKHHDAGSDAKACADILLKLCKKTSSSTIDSFLGSLNVRWGNLSEGNWRGSTVRPKLPHDLPEPRTDADKNHFLFGKHIALTGALPSGILRSKAQERIAYFGGIPQGGVNKETSLLVVGDIDPHKLAPGSEMSAKMKRAIELQAKGQKIEIISGFDFIPLLE